MAKNSFADWSTTANDNTDVGGINIAEGCAMANLNNGMREIMAQLKAGVPVSAATASGPASITLAEDTDNGTSAITVKPASSLGANRTVTIQDFDGSVYPLPGIPIFGCGQLQYVSTTSVKLAPFNGNLVSFPSGQIATIASAGISSTITSAYLNGTASQSLSATTLYYAYLWNQGSQTSPNWVIDWSTTGHATDTTTGIEIKSGDATRVLVGMIRTNAGPVIADTATARLVASWHNRRPVQMRNVFTADRSTSSTSYTEINTEIRCSFVTWGSSIEIGYAGCVFSSSGTISALSGPSVDGAGTGFPATRLTTTTTGQNASSAGALAPAEGYHYLTVMGAVVTGTGVWDSTSQQGSLYATLSI